MQKLSIAPKRTVTQFSSNIDVIRCMNKSSAGLFNKMKCFYKTPSCAVKFLFAFLLPFSFEIEEYCSPEDAMNTAIPFRMFLKGMFSSFVIEQSTYLYIYIIFLISLGRYWMYPSNQSQFYIVINNHAFQRKNKRD